MENRYFKRRVFQCWSKHWLKHANTQLCFWLLLFVSLLKMSACGFVYLQVSNLRKRVCKVFLRLLLTLEVTALEFHCTILLWNPSTVQVVHTGSLLGEAGAHELYGIPNASCRYLFSSTCICRKTKCCVTVKEKPYGLLCIVGYLKYLLKM